MKKILAEHPPSLFYFFTTEMWERYGFYVVQSLLALYLALHFKYNDKDIYHLVGTFTALTYLSPVMGGWIADQLLGQKKTILCGAVILFFSYLLLAFIVSSQGLIFALSGIAVGTGLLKPNISSLLGNEYSKESDNRESGFTIFYMGITMGIILGTTLPSQINYFLGWSYSFASAALGLILAISVFSIGLYRHPIMDYHPQRLTPLKAIQAFLLIFLLGFFCFAIISIPTLANIAFLLTIILAIGYLILSIWLEESPRQAIQNQVIGLLCLISVIFWTFYFQMFLSLTLFLARVATPTLFGILFPPPYYVTIQSLGMIIFGFFLSRKNLKLSLVNKGLDASNKFFLAIGFMTFAYCLISLICLFTPNQQSLSPLYFIPIYLLIALAELFLSPVGLSSITILASRKKVSTMMGVFFVSLGIGAFLSGRLAQLTSLDPNVLTFASLKIHYTQAFLLLSGLLIIATFISYLIKLWIHTLLKKATGRE